MQYASIIASLPMLRLGEKPLLTLEEFRGACDLLTEADAQELDALTAGETEQLHDDFSLRWLNADTQLRCALARARAEAAGADASASRREYTGYDVMSVKAVEDALGAKDPLDAERFLDQRRWALLEELSFGREFELDGVLAYAAKLQLAWRWASLDDEKAKQVIEETVIGNLTEEGSMVRFLDQEQEAAG